MPGERLAAHFVDHLGNLQENPGMKHSFQGAVVWTVTSGGNRKDLRMAKTKSKDGMYLELDGHVNLVTVKRGKRSIEPLDDEIVLKSLILLIDKAVNRYAITPEFAKKLKKKFKKGKITK